MNLRLSHDSIRMRLNSNEVLRLKESQSLAEETHLANESIRWEVRLHGDSSRIELGAGGIVLLLCRDDFHRLLERPISKESAIKFKSPREKLSDLRVSFEIDAFSPKSSQ